MIPANGTVSFTFLNKGMPWGWPPWSKHVAVPNMITLTLDINKAVKTLNNNTHFYYCYWGSLLHEAWSKRVPTEFRSYWAQRISQNLSQNVYSQVLRRLLGSVTRKRPRNWQYRAWQIHTRHRRTRPNLCSKL